MTTQTIKPLALDTYDVSNVVISSKYHDMPEYGFRTVNMSYNRDNTTYDKFEVKVTGNIVKIFEPANAKSKKYAALLKVTDPTSIELLQAIDDSLVTPVLSSKSTIFDGLKVGKTNLTTKIKTEDDIRKYRGKPLMEFNDQYQSYSLGFDFFSDKCTIVHSGDVAQEVRDADTILGKLPQHSQVTMVLQITKLSVNMKKCKWNPKATAMLIQCTSVGQGSSGSSPGKLSGADINDVDTKNITLDELKTNDYNGKYAPVKYNGKSLSLLFNDVEVRFMRNVNEDTGKTRFSLGVDLTEYKDKFDELDTHLLNTLYENQKDYFSKNDIEDDEELFANNFRGSLKEGKNGDRFTLWANIYAKDTDGTFDFDGKFFSVNGDEPVLMDNDDVLSTVFDSTEAIRTNLSVYVRYIWLGNDKSVKWYLGKAQVKPQQSVVYDLGLSSTTTPSLPRDEEADEFEDETEQTQEDETQIESADEISDEED